MSVSESKTSAGAMPQWAAGLDGHIALVTGAGRGLGRACALALSAAGAEVIAVARTEADLLTLAAEAHGETHGEVHCWVGDVTSDELLQRIEALTRLDVLVNNVGGNKPMPFEETPDDVLDWLLDLNVRAAFRVARSATRVMLSHGSGSIIHMSSQMGHVGSPGRTMYCMSKHAMEGLSKAMAVELAPQGIRVNTVAPTFIETPLGREMLAKPEFREFVLGMIPLGKIGQPEDVAAAVDGLHTERARRRPQNRNKERK
jgi:NAD(P)-dependent dehydrogenase (short-subunit alcohol dehydrogenase family)